MKLEEILKKAIPFVAIGGFAVWILSKLKPRRYGEIVDYQVD